MNYIRWFNEIGLSESALVGGKGANLGELTQSGLPVPPGFCITSAAYQNFLISTGLHRSIATLLATIDSADRVDVVDKTAQIRGLIYAQPLPPAIVDEVVGCYHKLQESGIVQPQEEVPLAVRSSATAEDQANASFAGQLDTYLNIRGIPALLEHIKRCWASLWTERVVAYIANQGLDHLSVSMAVVVQSMISSEVSGVLFTANPVTGGNDEVVINASWGLGEAIVSGLVTPDTIQARKSDGQVIQRQTGVKDLRLAYAPGGGTEELPVREDLRSSPALSDRQVKELVALGNRIEAYYGKPQDIEWAYYQGQWYLLQSRPITTLGSQSARQYVSGDFNRTMFIEIFPDSLSPIFLSIVKPLFKGMLDFTFLSLGFQRPKDIQAIGEFYNQPYFNRDYIAAAFQPLSPAIREPLIAQVVNPFGSHEEFATFELSWPFFSMAARILRFMIIFPKQLPEMLTRYQDEISRAESFPYEAASEAEITALIRRIPFEYANRLLNNDFLMIAVIGRSYRLLGSFLKRYYGKDADVIVAKLISGVTGNVTMETNKRLWDLAQIAKSVPSVGDILQEHDPQRVRMDMQKSSEGRNFLHALDQFLGEFGHREVRMDILYPTWGDDPEPILSFIRSYLDADEAQSPYRQQERLTRERQQMTDTVMKEVKKGLLGRLVIAPLFKRVLLQTQIHTRERDTMHFEMTRLFPPIRRLLLELGSRWTNNGLLDQDDDIFFLSLDEIEEMTRNPHPMREVIHSRRDVFTQNIHHAAPNIIRNGEEIYSGEVAIGENEAVSLQGVAGSPGKVSGIAHIIHGPEQFGELKKGEILVAPITNPVWTPLFAIAGGIITEVGGILSHGAIVAREYGIPAVMSVPGATQRIQGGQQVTVDGNTGVIYLKVES